ncbi:MAG: alkaline phosphatase D family protein [Bacteroidota bacterium]
MKRITAALFLFLLLLPFLSQAQNSNPNQAPNPAPNPANIQARTNLDTRFAPFYHGVASGDPLSDRVIIWTRVTPGQAGAVTVNWEVATDTAMSNVVQSGSYTTSDSMDYTVNVDVTGLQPGTWYYYRFERAGRYSLTGRTFTAPSGTGVDSLRFGVVSCSNYANGYFNVYGNIARRNDVHAILHLGDYLYEHGSGSGDREHEPNYEILDLTDYRMRHSQYKLDEDLRCIHQMYPFISVWDDHESANDAWKGGADNHDPNSEGDWTTRKGSAVQAYLEWMPIRQPDPVNDPERIYRTVRYGDLLDFIMLDTRLIGRDEQGGLGDGDDPNRRLLGDAQLGWLSSEMETSAAQWKILGQQVMMAPLEVFGLPVNSDQWDGYQVERQRVYDSILTKNIENVVVLTGDIHTAWANDLPGSNYDSGTGSGSVAVEFVTSSVTSTNSVVNVGQQLIQLANDHIKYINLSDHGYILLTVTQNETQGDYFFINDIDNPQTYGYSHDASWKVKAGNRWLESASDTMPAPVGVHALQPSKTPPNLAINVTDPANPAGTVALLGAYPNPFSADFMVKYYAHKAGSARMQLVDIQGKVVAKKEMGKQAPGLHLAGFEGLEALASGYYLLTLEVAGQSVSRRIFRY